MGKEELSREELFALIWEKPTVEVAKELGVSDVAVAKLCARLQVPKPPRGYWARIESGQTPRRAPLRAFRKAMARPLPGVIGLTPIQRKFVDQALSELAAKGIDINDVRIASNQIREIPPDVAAQMLLLIQNRYPAWIKGGEVVECQQIGAVFGQAFHRPIVFHAVSFDEEIEGGVGPGFGFRHPDVFQMRLGLGLQRLGQSIEDICCLVHPAALHAGLAVNLTIPLAALATLWQRKKGCNRPLPAR